MNQRLLAKIEGVVDYLHRTANVHDVVDFNCGDGELLAAIGRPDMHCWGYDADVQAVDRAIHQRYVEVYQGDVFCDHSFWGELAICTNPNYHVIHRLLFPIPKANFTLLVFPNEGNVGLLELMDIHRFTQNV